MAEIQPADRRARRRALAVLVPLLVAPVAVTYLLEQNRARLEAWLTANRDLLLAHPWLAALASLVLVLPVIGAALWAWRLGGRVIAAERYPPPGVPVIRDSVVRRGRAAVWRGRVARWAALVLIAASVCLPLAAWQLLRLLSRG